ncbi:MAG: dihydroorotate dehydrogenase-like protein [Prolixibacteraceae bacterium]
MADLTTKYLGMNLKSPVIAGSCGLTSSVDKIKQLEKNGAGAIVLKSIFEEEILLSANKDAKDAKQDELLYYDYSETFDYLDVHERNKEINNYLQLIREAKKNVLIPVIASINCVTEREWTDFALKVQEAGADALELNLFFNPTGLNPQNKEDISIRIINKLLKKLTIPLSVKLSSNYSNLGSTLLKVSETGVGGLVLFNRFFSVDFDIEKLNVVSSNIYSSPEEISKSLRWVALLSDKINCSIAASGGVHSGDAVIKQILAGADAVQVVSALYQNGIDFLTEIHKELDEWLERKGYHSLGQIQGLMSYRNIENPEVFERMQFMKYYGEIF